MRFPARVLVTVVLALGRGDWSELLEHRGFEPSATATLAVGALEGTGDATVITLDPNAIELPLARQQAIEEARCASLAGCPREIPSYTSR